MIQVNEVNAFKRSTRRHDIHDKNLLGVKVNRTAMKFSSKTIPVCITVYTRIDHFKMCIEALQNNLLSERCELFIFSDGASVPEHEEQVDAVRVFANAIKGFRKVNVIEREINIGYARNTYYAALDVVNKFGYTIYLEDDIVTAPGFISFLNGAIEQYGNNQKVASITGYCPPIDIPGDLVVDTFCMARYSAWGSVLFKRTFPLFENKISLNEFNEIEDKNIFKKFGPDVLNMIDMEIQGKIDAADVRCMYRQVINNKMTIYPKKSLVQNIGHDGSGVHCGNTAIFHHKSLWDKIDSFRYSNSFELDERIIKANYDFRSFK